MREQALAAGFTQVHIDYNEFDNPTPAEPVGLEITIQVGPLPMLLFEDTLYENGYHPFSDAERKPRWGVIPEVTESDDFDTFDSGHIDLLELTDEQLFFLNWANGWAQKIQPFWRGETDFTCVEEFVQDLKENYETLYERQGSAMKSATKK